eukprot:6218634-Pyramimonas_sp.AAC.1
MGGASPLMRGHCHLRNHPLTFTPLVNTRKREKPNESGDVERVNLARTNRTASLERLAEQVPSLVEA